MSKIIKVIVEIDTAWFDPEEYDTKPALDKLKKDIHMGIGNAIGIQYSDIEITKIEVTD